MYFLDLLLETFRGEIGTHHSKNLKSKKLIWLLKDLTFSVLFSDFIKHLKST